MVKAQQIRNKAEEWLQGSISLPDFHSWFASETCDAHRSDDFAARNLAASIDLSLSEYTSGHLSLDGLKDDVRQAVRVLAKV